MVLIHQAQAYTIVQLAPTVKHTLMIDDCEIDLFIQRRLLEVLNFSAKFSSFTSADDALEWLSNQPEGELPDLILLDLNMPKTDGFAFLERFSQLPETITKVPRIVILTSSNSGADMKRTRSYDKVVGFITKPIKQSDLEELRKLFPPSDN
jgi:two-component system nitrate/nitrite response regulator NarL